MKFIEDNPYFNLTVDNISKADYDTIEDSNSLNSAYAELECLPSTVEDCWEIEDAELYCKSEYSDELSNLSHHIAKLCFFLADEGFTFKYQDKAKVAWNKLNK